MGLEANSSTKEKTDGMLPDSGWIIRYSMELKATYPRRLRSAACASRFASALFSRGT